MIHGQFNAGQQGRGKKGSKRSTIGATFKAGQRAAAAAEAIDRLYREEGPQQGRGKKGAGVKRTVAYGAFKAGSKNTDQCLTLLREDTARFRRIKSGTLGRSQEALRGFQTLQKARDASWVPFFTLGRRNAPTVKLIGNATKSRTAGILDLCDRIGNQSSTISSSFPVGLGELRALELATSLPGGAELHAASLGSSQSSFGALTDPKGFVFGDGSEDVDGETVCSRVVHRHKVNAALHQVGDHRHIPSESV